MTGFQKHKNGRFCMIFSSPFVLLERRDLRCFEKCRIGMYVVRKFKHEGGRRGPCSKDCTAELWGKSKWPKASIYKDVKKAILYGVSHKQTMGQQIANKTNSFWRAKELCFRGTRIFLSLCLYLCLCNFATCQFSPILLAFPWKR